MRIRLSAGRAPEAATVLKQIRRCAARRRRRWAWSQPQPQPPTQNQTWGLASPWPNRCERLRLWRHWRRWQRRPRRPGERPARVPLVWARQARLVFWWTLLGYALEQPWISLAAVLAAPGWLFLALRWLWERA